MDLNKFFELLDKAGQIPTIIDHELGLARADNPSVNENPHIQAAHAATAALGTALEALEQWGKGELATKPVEPPVEPSKPPVEPPHTEKPQPPARLRPDLEKVMMRYVLNAQFTQEVANLRAELGDSFNNYVNEYGFGGNYWNLTREFYSHGGLNG